MSFKAGVPFLILLAWLIASCGSSHATRSVERIALLHFEDLTSSAQAAWIGVAIPAIAAAELVSAPDRYAYIAMSSNDAWLNRPTRLVRGYVLSGAQGALRMRVVEQDAKSGNDVARYEVTGGSAVELADGLARHLWKDAPALQKADPSLKQEIDAGKAQIVLQALSAKLMPQVPLEQAAMAAGQRPSDSRLAALAGRYAMVRRDFKQAGEWFEKALKLDPENGALHNEAAYVEVFTGSPDAALKNIAQYERVDPQGANPLDSRGEILLMSHRFGEAEEAFQAAYSRDPRFLGSLTLRKAAISHRAAGDLLGADDVFKRFMDAIAGNPLADLYQAQWDYESGRDAKAFERLQKLGGSIAMSQLAVWRRDVTDAATAMKLAGNDVERNQARLAMLVAQPQTPPELRAGEAKALVLALRGDHQLAIPELKAVIARTTPIEATQWQVLLAWAMVQSGQAPQAKGLLAYHPIPNQALSLSESVVMRRYLAMKKMGI